MKKFNQLWALCLLMVSMLTFGILGTTVQAAEPFVYGTTAYGPSMLNVGTNPHDGYVGWSTIRYGVGETLFKFNDHMEPKPWLAEKFEHIDDKTVEITVKEGVTFSNGKEVTGEAVKACLDHLMEVHERAAADLQITNIEADGQVVTITTDAAPALINNLSDPYGCIIDMEAGGLEDNKVIGTGPYLVDDFSDTEMNLTANKDYWADPKPTVEKVKVLSITDGDTLTMALQNGEIQLAQGMPYASYPLFEGNDAFKMDSTSTSRVYQIAFNFETEALKDHRVREAIAYAVDKHSFADVLLEGNGAPTQTPFPESYNLYTSDFPIHEFNLEKAQELLKEAGWTEKNKDGILEKDGKPLKLRYLTYGARQELPLLAEMVQGSLQEIGIDLEVTVTDDYKKVLEEGKFDLFSNAIVTAPTGDSQYYLMTHLGDSDYNEGHYHNKDVEKLLKELTTTVKRDDRVALTDKILKQMDEDIPYIYTAHLKMTLIMDKNVEGVHAHPTDYYEITSELSWKQ